MSFLATSQLPTIGRVAACWLICCVASAQLRIVSWNTNGGARNGTATVLEAIGLEEVNGIAKPIDVLSLQEQSGEDTQSIVDVLNDLYGEGVYAAAPTPAGAETLSDGLPGMVYNIQTVVVQETTALGSVSETSQARSTLRYKIALSTFLASPGFFLYNSHYHSSPGADGEARRLGEAKTVRFDVSSKSTRYGALLSGDFSTYSSNEPGYQALVAPGLGQAVDPLGSPGDWHDNSLFRGIHTQSPATSSQFPGQDTGGVNDRFDFQLVNENLMDGEGFDLIPGSYRAFGNNGTHDLNGSIASGTGATPDVLSALEQASDHLPIVADYQVPANIRYELAISGDSPHYPHLSYYPGISYEAGSLLQVIVSVENDARVVAPNGADELAYKLSADGSLLDGGEFFNVEEPLAAPSEYVFTVDTSTPGVKTVRFKFSGFNSETTKDFRDISTTAQSRFFRVHFSGDYNEDGVVDAADYTVWRDSVGQPLGTLPNDPTLGSSTSTIGSIQYQIWRDNYGRRISDVIGSTYPVPDPAAAILLLIGLLGAARFECTPIV